MVKRLLWMFSLCCIVAVTVIGGGPLSSGAATKMPVFKLEDVVSGKKIDSKIFAGKSLLVTFFASWCPPCLQEIPSLIDLQEKYGEQRFSVIALSMDQEKKAVRELVTKKEINYPVMMANNSVAAGFGGVYGVPTSFLINRHGTVVKKYSGYVPHAVLVRDLQQIID